MSLLAQIYKDDELLFDNIMVDIIEKIDPRSTLKSWQGTFEISISQHIEPGGPYRLVLKDGRVGEFNVSNVKMTFKRPTVVHFLGSGSLE